MAPVFGLSFDLDDTLWSLDNVIEEAEKCLWSHLARQHPAICERYDMATFRELRDRVTQEDPGIAHNMTEVRLRMLRLAARETGEPESLAEQAFQVFLDARNQVAIYEDSVTVLDRLRGRYHMLALTNGNADVHRIGLGHYFSHSISAIHVGAAKPDPAMFHAACSHAGLTPDQMVHVGDNPEADVVGAARVGMRAVWLNRPGVPWPDHLEPVPHVEIRSLHDLLVHLETLPEVRS